MKPRYHIVSSVVFGVGFLAVFKDFKYAFVCMLAGILIDLDHLVDFYRHNKAELLSPFKIYKDLKDWCLGLKFDVVYIFLHSLELVFLIWLLILIFTLGLFWIAIAVGITQHMILDIVFNARYFLPPQGYFFIYRLKKGFKKNSLLQK